MVEIDGKKKKNKKLGQEGKCAEPDKNRKRNRVFMESGAMQCSPSISQRIPNTRGRALLYY